MRDAGGTLRTITRVRMRDNAGTLRTIQQIRMRDAAGTLRTVFQYLTAAASPTSVNGSNFGPDPSGIVSSDPSTATPTGGTAPYTYLWTQVSGTAGIDPNTPTLAETQFTDSACSGLSEGVFKCTVTDNNGATADTNTVAVSLTWTQI